MKVARRVDPQRYRRLVTEVSPAIIETAAENERVLAIVEKLLPKARSAEEDAILELLVHLVEDFEGKAYPSEQTSPAVMVAFLLEQRGLKAIDLAETLGSRGRVSEILSGKRAISKEHAKKLGEFFHVSPAAFI